MPQLTLHNLVDSLETLHTQLLHAQSQTAVAMTHLARAAKVLPAAAVGFEPLLSLDADITARLAAFDALEHDIRNVRTSGELEDLKGKLRWLAIPGAGSARYNAYMHMA